MGSFFSKDQSTRRRTAERKVKTSSSLVPKEAGSPRKARALVTSRPPQSISSAINTTSAHFAPLEKIGSLRPRTATSTNTSKVCFSDNVEIRRSATSHAATTNPSIEPASACFKPPQPKYSAYPPCPTKPEHLDDIHPAYREPPNEETVRLILRRSPRSDQLRPRFEENPPPPPLPSQAKHSPQSTTNLLTQGQELPLPPLPSRSQITELSGSSASSRTAVTIDTSKRTSDAITVFFDIEGGTGITTEDFDFPAFLARAGRNFDVSRSSFV